MGLSVLPIATQEWAKTYNAEPIKFFFTNESLYYCPACGMLNMLEKEIPTDRTFRVSCSSCEKVHVINTDYFHPYL